MSANIPVDVLNTAADPDMISYAPLHAETDDRKQTEEEIYDYTQSLRRQIIRHARHSLDQINDPKVVTNLLKAASDMDKQEISKRRLKNEEAQTRNQAATHAMIADILNSVPSTTKYKIPDNPNPVDPKLPEDLEDLKLVEGETDIGTSTMTHEAFEKNRKQAV
jgi:hypothetical protein